MNEKEEEIKILKDNINRGGDDEKELIKILQDNIN